MSIFGGIVITVLLLAANAFFVAAEFAVMSARRAQIEPMVEQGRRGAQLSLWALEHVSVMLATAQLGVTLCSTGLGAVAEPALAHLVEGPLVALGMPAASSHIFGFAAALMLVVYLHVVFGEMVPKNISVSMPEQAILILAPALVAVERLFGPIVRFLDRFANGLLRLMGVEPKSEVGATFTLEEVASIVEISRAEGVLKDEVGLISSTIEFSTETARSAMVPLDKIVTVEETATPLEIEKEVGRTGFSRFLVRDEDDGDLVGYLHVKDILYASLPAGEAKRNLPVESWRIRSLARVDAQAEVDDALRVMQATATHIAVVTEGKTPVGVLFLEDIIEELVGEVRDTMQKEEAR
ncbi:hemolysin family protein [Actinomycetaceae bacterium TAE3-ERU4]|nr:hemolysin family protein [Actinomycetaceae bacterium TAE3-ERU4]